MTGERSPVFIYFVLLIAVNAPIAVKNTKLINAEQMKYAYIIFLISLFIYTSSE